MYKKFICFWIVAWMSLAATGLAATYYVDADGGSDSNAGTSSGAAWASLSKASSHTFQPGDQILLQCGDTFNGKLVLDDENGTEQNPIVVASYDSGNRPVIDAAGYLAGVHITSCDYIELRDLEITGDGGAHIDGSDGTDRYGVYINNTTDNDADGITISNVYFHTIYPYAATEHEGHNPTTYLGTGIDARGQSSNPSENLVIEDCHFENLGYRSIYLKYQNNTQILDNLMENIGGPSMTPNRCDDLLVRGNTINGSGQYTDPRMHGRGSGIWPISCNRVLIEKNAFMHARGRYDSCGVHIDIGCSDVVVQYNLSMDNEGGFVEILGNNYNCAYRYNISINDGARRAGTNENGLGVGDGHVLLFSGHNFSGLERTGPFNSYIYNNTIYVKHDQLCSFLIEQTTWGMLIANNLFFIDGPVEDESPLWRGEYPAGMPDSVVWTNNLYQRGKIFPEDWVFYETNPIFGNPNLTNPGGLTAADYIPDPNAFVEGRGIEIPNIPGDTIGLAIGLEVTEDYFGNPIQGLPDIGAVEVGSGVSMVLGAAFLDRPTQASLSSVIMTAVSAPAGSEYYFDETSGNPGGTDSGWQSDPTYSDSGLLANTTYAYSVSVRDGQGQNQSTSVVEYVTVLADLVILDEDFSFGPNPANTASPFPENTWYLDGAQTWSSESQESSVDTQSDETMRVGWGYDEVLLQYFSNQTWDLSLGYEFSGDWRLETVFENHLGLIVGVGEYDPTTGALLQRIKEITVGETTSPVAGQTGSFTLSISPAELQSAGVSAASLVGVFLHHDDDGVLYSQGTPKGDLYHVDNLFLRCFDSSPYSGTPISLPGKLQAEEYDLGGEGIAYHDTTAGNTGGDFRTDDVDITAQYGGNVLAWVTEEEWLKYTVNAAAGTYDITLRASTGVSNRNVTLTLDGNVLGTVNVPNMGWPTFGAVTLEDVVIPATSSGKLQLDFDGGVNVDWIDFTLLKGDADFSGAVDIDDLYLLATQWLSDCLVEAACADLDYSGKVGMSDFMILSDGWTMP